MNWKLTLAAAILAIGFATPGFGQPVPAAPVTHPKGEAATVAEIQAQLATADPAQHKLAVDAIRARLQNRPTSALSDFKSYWAKPLMAARLYQPTADLAFEAILLDPSETRSIEAALQVRIKALLALNQAEQALSDAKSLFNVSTMSGTSEAILTLAECISTARPKDVDLFNRFREEQIAGATFPAATTRPAALTRPSADLIRRSTVLDSIKINPKPYDDALAKLTGEDATSLMARGNLLLLAGKPAEARPILERMYSLSGAELAEATEALARLMKAEDGTIGRANAWLISLRPAGRARGGRE